MNPIQLLKQHCKFEKSNEVYVLFGIARRKNNENITNGTEVVFREIIRNTEDIEKKYNKLKNAVKNYIHTDGSKLNFYIYISINPRNCIKAMFKLKQNLNNWSLELINGVDCNRRLQRLDLEWMSCLMSPICKSGRGKWLVDFDSKEEDKLKMFKSNLELNKSKVYLESETRNGYHLIVEPFNRSKFPVEDYYEFKVDALCFVEYISINEEN